MSPTGWPLRVAVVGLGSWGVEHARAWASIPGVEIVALCEQDESRLRDVVEGTAKVHGAKATLTYRRDYPVTSNHPLQTEFAAAVAGQVVGTGSVDSNTPPLMGAEDFSFMLEARPGAFIFIGNGDSAGLHNAGYDFNDDVIPIGASYWARLVETALPI